MTQSGHPMTHNPTVTAEMMPETTNRQCDVCGAVVAAFPEVMCCHCQTVPWKVTAQSEPVVTPSATVDDLKAVRPEVAAFALLMERKLQANDHKPGWKADDLEALAERAGQEAGELRMAIRELNRQIVWRNVRTPGEHGNGWSRQLPSGQRQVGCGYREMQGDERGEQLTKIAEEAADVANFAMMIADVALNPKRPDGGGE